MQKVSHIFTYVSDNWNHNQHPQSEPTNFSGFEQNSFLDSASIDVQPAAHSDPEIELSGPEHSHLWNCPEKSYDTRTELILGAKESFT